MTIRVQMVKTVAVLGLVAACGSDDEATCEVDGGAACFQLPTEPMIARMMGVGTDPPNLTCAKPAPVTTTTPVTISGTLKNYTSGAPIAGVRFEAYPTLVFSGFALTTTTTAADGTFTATIPNGSPSIFHLKLSGSGILPGYGLYQRLDLAQTTVTDLDYRAPTQDLLDLVETIIHVQQQPDKIIAAGTVSDCDGKTIEHAIVTVSTTSKTVTHAPGVQIFYGAAGELPLPVIREERADTNNNGAVAILNAPSGGDAYVQAWGFPDAAAVSKGKDGLELVAEWPILTEPGAVIAIPIRASSAP